MKLYNRYILIVTLLLLLTTIIMVLTGQNSLFVYYNVYVIEALIITELFIHFNNKTRRSLNIISTMLLGGFAIAMGLQVYKILM